MRGVVSAVLLAGVSGIGPLYGQQASSVQLGSSTNPSIFGQAVTLTAIVTPPAAPGKVTFYDGVTVLGTKSLIAGQAMLSVTLLASGARSLKAYYGGSATYAASTSPAIAQTVNVVAANGFSAPATYSVSGLNPGKMAQGDFNNDGKMDLVLASATSVAIVPGNGDGTFGTAKNIYSNFNAVQPDAVAVGDFNGDGNADLAVADAAGGLLLIFLGNGDGTFQSPVTYNAGTYFEFVAVGDFNGDGKPDLVAASFYGGLSVFLGNGDGTFQPALTNPYVGSPRFVAVADVNGDGKADLAVATLSNVAILLGNGDGTFRTPTFYTAGTNPIALSVGDLNGDGKPDLVVADYSTGNNLNVLLGNGDGTFGPATSYLTGPQAICVALADFNGDGKLDVAVLNGSDPSSGEVSVLWGNGDGTLQPPVSYSLSNYIGQWLIVGDFNGDGRVDIAVDVISVRIYLGAQLATPMVSLAAAPNPSKYSQAVTLTATVSPAAATGAVSFFDGSTALGTATLSNGQSTLTVATLSPGAHSIHAQYGGDSNDPAADSAALTQTVTGTLPATITTLGSSLNPANYGQSVALTAAVSPSSATGRVTFYDGVSILGTKALLNGQAAISTSQLPAGSHLLIAHYSGDGNDLPSTSGALAQSVKRSTGNGLRPPVNYNAGSFANAIAAGDFNGDGKMDLAVGGSGVNILLGNGDGTFQPAVSYATSYADVLSIAVGDFNGDGKTDIAVTVWYGAINILFGNGDGTFQAPVVYTTGNYMPFISVGDFNGDGSPDLAIADETQGSVDILLNNGDGTFQAPAPYASGYTPVCVATGDFNGDGKTDLVVSNTSSGNISVFLGNGNGTFQPAATYSGPSIGMGSVVVGDFNGDGKADIAVTYSNLITGLAVFLGNGDGTFGNPLTTPVSFGWSIYYGAIAVGDFDGDGKLDIAAGITTGSTDPTTTGNDFTLLLGNGDGTFRSVVTYTGHSQPWVVVGDFNGDGMPDIAAANATGAATVMLGGMGTRLQFTGYPVSGTVGAALSPVTVQSQDTSGNAVDVWNASPVSLASNPASVTASTPLVMGVATFNSLVFNSAGIYFLNSTSNGLTSATTSGPVIVSAAKLVFSTQPSNGVTGTAVPPFTVQVQDGNGNVITSSTASITVTSSPAGVGATVTAVNGAATFSSLIFPSPGSYTLTATSTGASSAVSSAFTIANPAYTISGTVLLNGAGLSGVSIVLNGSQSGSWVTNIFGFYGFGGLAAGGNYTITPTQAGYTFSPVSQTVTDLSANQYVTFTATPAPNLVAVTGQVTVGGVGLGGVAINVNGSQTTSVVTNGSGSYSIQLPQGGTYTLSAALSGYSFSVPVTFNNLSASQTANFTGIAVTNNCIGMFSTATNLVCSSMSQGAFPGNPAVSIGAQTIYYGATTLVGNVPFNDAAGMALYNAGGGGGASVSLDLYNTSSNGGIPQAKIKAIDDGNYSDHLTFWTKTPGGPNNGVTEKLRITSTGNVGIGTTNPTLGPLQMGSGAFVSAGGVWTNASDRNLKENFVPVVPAQILEKIDAIPLTEWNYKNEDPLVRHIGPVAQDIFSIFGVGNTSTTISTIDPSGIALAGIQGLDQKSQARAARLAELKIQLAAKTDELRSLEERISLLESLVEQRTSGARTR